jgi:hypothetical protein
MTAAEQITEYLSKQAEPHTAAEIAEATGVNKATVERQLRTLRDAGTAHTVGIEAFHGNAKTWALTPAALSVLSADPVNGDVEETGDWMLDVPPTPMEDEFDSLPVLNLSEWSAPEDEAYAARTEPLTEAQEEEMIRLGLTEEEYRARPVTEGTLTASGKVVEYDPDDAFTDDDPEVEHGEPENVTDTAPSATVASMTTDTVERPSRREQVNFHKRGQLSDEVLSYLAANPSDEFTPHMIAKTGMSGTGAVAYTLEALTNKGKVTRTSDKPKRYQHKDPATWPVEEPKAEKVKAPRKSKKEKAAEAEAEQAATV